MITILEPPAARLAATLGLTPEIHPAWCNNTDGNMGCGIHIGMMTDIPATAGAWDLQDDGALYPMVTVYAHEGVAEGCPPGAALSVSAPGTGGTRDAVAGLTPTDARRAAWTIEQALDAASDRGDLVDGHPAWCWSGSEPGDTCDDSVGHLGEPHEILATGGEVDRAPGGAVIYRRLTIAARLNTEFGPGIWLAVHGVTATYEVDTTAREARQIVAALRAVATATDPNLRKDQP